MKERSVPDQHCNIRTKKKKKEVSQARTRTDILSYRPLPDQCTTPPEDLHRRGSQAQIPTAAPSGMLSWRAAVPVTRVMEVRRGYMLRQLGGLDA